MGDIEIGMIIRKTGPSPRLYAQGSVTVQKAQDAPSLGMESPFFIRQSRQKG
jgi:hypothetical protein